MTRVLVTNDDGIGSTGVRLLAVAALRAGLDVVVAAPMIDASGSSASIAVVEHDGQVAVQRHDLTELAGVAVYGVAAPPAFITLIASRGAFGAPPDLVFSGINRGANTGRSVLHSGTVGAALTAAANGRPALAMSLDLAGHPDEPSHWQTAADLVGILLPVLSDQFALNVNVPNLPRHRVRGLLQARLASFGTVQTTIVEDDRSRVEVEVDDTGAGTEPDTDVALLAAGYASLTPLTPPREAAVPPLDVPPLPDVEPAG